MELIAFAISIPGLTVLLLGWVWWVQRRRKRFMRRLEAHSCRVCGGSFAEVIAEDCGRPTSAELAKLDRFQRRFAARKVLCHECGSVNLCTAAGEPFKGLVVVDDG